MTQTAPSPLSTVRFSPGPVPESPFRSLAALLWGPRPGEEGDRPLLLLGILLIFTGVQLVTLGLLAEMQARTYHESQDKPIYVIRDVLEAQVADVPVAAMPARHQ